MVLLIIMEIALFKKFCAEAFYRRGAFSFIFVSAPLSKRLKRRRSISLRLKFKQSRESACGFSGLFLFFCRIFHIFSLLPRVFPHISFLFINERFKLNLFFVYGFVYILTKKTIFPKEIITYVKGLLKFWQICGFLG